MPTCPRCQTAIEPDAIQCPQCQLALKAFGHPGIPLHRADSETFLCETCLYHVDDTCNFPQRPLAKTCTLYQDAAQPLEVETYRPSASLRLKGWLRRHAGLLLVLGLLGLSLLLAIARSN